LLLLYVFGVLFRKKEKGAGNVYLALAAITKVFIK